MPVIIVLVLLGLNFPAYVAMGWLLFGSTEAFGEAMERAWKWEVRSLLDGDYLECKWARLRMGVFFVACAALIFGEYKLVMLVIDKIVGS